ARAADVPTARGRAREPRARGALPAPVPRAAEPVLPEFVLQPVGSPSAPAGNADRDDGAGRRHAARIVDGDGVTGGSQRGAARFTARVTDATRPGVVVIEGIWWHRFHPDGRGVNVLTSDRVTDLGGGPAFHSNLVEVSRA